MKIAGARFAHPFSSVSLRIHRYLNVYFHQLMHLFISPREE